jgi:hypothetical protein
LPRPSESSLWLALRAYNVIMRCLTYISACALSLSLSLFTPPAVAQHGGGGHGGGGGHAGGFGGGGHAGFSGGHAGGFSGSRSSAVHMASGARGQFRGGFSGNRFSGNRFSGNRFSAFRGRGPIFDNFRRCFGCRGFVGFPWGYGGYYDPYWWGDSGYDDSYDQDYEYDRGVAQQMNQDSLEQQRMLRQEEADGDQDAYAQQYSQQYARRVPMRDPGPDSVRGSGRGSGNEAQGAPIMPATILVYRDQHRQEVQNYAIVGTNLWSFSPQHNQKIPLAELDLAATAKANDENGVSFRIPNAGEGQ